MTNPHAKDFTVEEMCHLLDCEPEFDAWGWQRDAIIAKLQKFEETQKIMDGTEVFLRNKNRQLQKKAEAADHLVGQIKAWECGHQQWLIDAVDDYVRARGVE